MKKYKVLLLLSVAAAYAFMYVATSYPSKCEGDCLKLADLSSTMYNNRPYIYSINRCGRASVSDTLCVFVKDTTGIDWNLLADSTCYFATGVGLPGQKIFIIKNTVFPWDTVATKQCP